MKVCGADAASGVVDSCGFQHVYARSGAEWQEIPPSNDN